LSPILISFLFTEGNSWAYRKVRGDRPDVVTSPLIGQRRVKLAENHVGSWVAVSD
jgi:hypothetical protein